MLKTQKDSKSDKVCTQCGTCCRKGGPAIHDKDLDLLKNGTLRLEDLMTFRPGEFVRDESQRKIVPLEKDVVKIAPPIAVEEHNWECRFLIAKDKKHSCALHGKHPAECRALYCQNPEFLLALPSDGRQTRQQLIEFTNSPAWWLELIDTHAEKCSLNDIAECLVKLDNDNQRLDEQSEQSKQPVSDEEKESLKEKMLEIISFDNSFRELVCEKANINPELLPFLFGRPVLGLMHQFQVEILKTPSGLLLKKAVGI